MGIHYYRIKVQKRQVLNMQELKVEELKTADGVKLEVGIMSMKLTYIEALKLTGLLADCLGIEIPNYPVIKELQ